MDEVKFRNVEQVLRRTVKEDGRVGGLQKYINAEVDVVTYRQEEEDV